MSAYTKVLQAAENNSVTIASIGELTNLRDILMAEEELFISKVKVGGCNVVWLGGWVRVRRVSPHLTPPHLTPPHNTN